MKNIIIVFSLLPTIVVTAQNPDVEAFFYPSHKLSDFNLKGKVKSVVSISHTVKEDGGLEKDTYSPSTKTYYFDNRGLLTEEIHTNDSKDTFLYAKYTYSKKEKLVNIEKYESMLGGVIQLNNKNTFEKAIIKFTYSADGKLVMKEESGINQHSWINQYSSDGVLLRSDWSESESALNNKTWYRIYDYDSKLKKITGYTELKGSLTEFVGDQKSEKATYTYDNNLLQQKSITPMNGAMPSITIYHKDGFVMEEIVGDTTKNVEFSEGKYVYFNYNKWNYDDSGNMISNYFHSNADGEIINKTKFTYQFDKTGNWLEMKTALAYIYVGDINSERIYNFIEVRKLEYFE